MLGRFGQDRGGNVLIISALSLPVLIGMGALVAEYGGALLTRAENQRIADMSSYAGALAYSSTKNETNMQNAAKNVALLNGIPAASVTVTLGTSPRTAGAQAVSVRIATQKPLFLSKVLSNRVNLDIVTQAQAEVGSAAAATPGCVLALSGTDTGITLSGGAKITANECNVASNNTVTVPCGTTISTTGLNYNSAAAPAIGCTGGVVAPSGKTLTIAKKATVDPLLGNTAVASAVARVTTAAGLVTPATPSAPTAVTGTNIDFGWGDKTSISNAAVAAGCTAAFTQNPDTWTFTCPSTKTVVNLGNITIGGGINLKFNVNGPSTTTYNFSGDFTSSATTIFGPGIYNFAKNVTTNGTTHFGVKTISGSTYTYGSGTYLIGGLLTTNGTTTFGDGNVTAVKGIKVGGGGTTTFGIGTFKLGRMDADCAWDSGKVSICNAGTLLTFGGPSTFEINSGFYNSGGARLNFGSGSTNSYKIGSSSNGNAIALGGGSVTYMAGASLFEVNGTINGGGGGSCLILPAATNHDINGNFNASGAVKLGAGLYTIDGYFTLGANGGGSATCDGETVSVKGVDVTLMISGKATANSGSCSGYVFCIAAGYSNIVLTAPTTGTYAKLAIVGPQVSTRTAGAILTEGGSGALISGAFYFPNGPIEMNGGASTMGSGTDRCLQLIGSRITLTGGTAAASECIAATGSSSSSAATKVTVVQ